MYGHSTVSCDLLSVNTKTENYSILMLIWFSFKKGYGKADHAESRRVLLTKYSDYDIEISNEGY